MFSRRDTELKFVNRSVGRLLAQAAAGCWRRAEEIGLEAYPDGAPQVINSVPAASRWKSAVVSSARAGARTNCSSSPI